MTQPSLLPLADTSTTELSSALLRALSDGRWHHREDLAKTLGVSVRAIRDAASHAGGEVISGQRGLKLTLCATPDELNESVGRCRSQIREMSRRMAETERVWHGRQVWIAKARQL